MFTSALLLFMSCLEFVPHCSAGRTDVEEKITVSISLCTASLSDFVVALFCAHVFSVGIGNGHVAVGRCTPGGSI